MLARLDEDKGFTLMELLVALTLLGLLTMLMFGSLRFGVQVWARSNGTISQDNALGLAETRVRNDLSRAYPMYRSNGTKASVAFEGAPRAISYLVPSQEMPGALVRVALRIEDDNGSLQLSRTEELELATTPSPHTKLLLQHLKNAEFAYFGRASAKEPPFWSNSWRQATSLPSLIKIGVQTNDGRWSEWVVAPRIVADVGCVFDPLTKSCRGR